MLCNLPRPLRLAARLVAFCLLAALLLWYADAVLTEKSSTFWSLYDEPRDTIDGLYVGGSHANAAISPLQIYQQQGFTGYVAYSWSQPIWTSYYYIKEALKTQDPQVVVLDTFGLVYGNTYIEAPLIDATSDQFSPRIKPGLNRLLLTVAMSRCQVPHKPFYQYNSLLQFHTRWKFLTAQDWTWPFVSHENLGKGFGPIYTTEVFQQSQPAAITEQAGYAPAEEYLYKIIELSKKEGFQLVLVDLPYIATETEYGIYARARRICEENGVPYLSYLLDETAAQAGFDYRTDMAEHAHVNYKGAAKLSAHLGAWLAQQYDLPDHRQDAAYARWSELAETERRDLQDGDLAMTHEPLALLQKAMGERYLLVVQTQGDLTGADGAALAAAFDAVGMDGSIFASSTAHALYVFEGGEMRYGPVAEGETLAYTWTNGPHTVEADSRPDGASCRLDGEEIGRDRPGVNIAVVDRQTGERVQSISFSTLHSYAAFTE